MNTNYCNNNKYTYNVKAFNIIYKLLKDLVCFHEYPLFSTIKISKQQEAVMFLELPVWDKETNAKKHIRLILKFTCFIITTTKDL